MKHCMLLMIVLYATNANAVALHVGDASIPFSETKNTSPALAVNVNDKVYYGALFNDTPAPKTLRIEYKGTEYWLGEFCAPGTYAPSGTNTCIACGIGHYCTGGHHRGSCTYGAIGCPGAQHASDGALPNGAPINQFMTLEQVNQYIPPTDISQWKKLSCCAEMAPGGVMAYWDDSINDIKSACADGVIGPGTYLFVARYPGNKYNNYIDTLSGGAGLSNVYTAVFDHPVGYRSIHGNSVFHHFVDTNNAPYQEWTISAPQNSWMTNINASNVSNIPSQVETGHLLLCVFELK